jgi:hypothetical protein
VALFDDVPETEVRHVLESVAQEKTDA